MVVAMWLFYLFGLNLGVIWVLFKQSVNEMQNRIGHEMFRDLSINFPDDCLQSFQFMNKFAHRFFGITKVHQSIRIEK